MQEATLTGKVKIINLAPWPVYFRRLQNIGDIEVQANSTLTLDRGEVEQQCYSGNVLFMGTDGHGAHAHLIIDDKALRNQFEIPDDQQVMTDEFLDKVFAYKTMASFTKKVKESTVRDYERHRLIDYIKRKKINDFEKVRFVEDLVGVKIQM